MITAAQSWYAIQLNPASYNVAERNLERQGFSFLTQSSGHEAIALRLFNGTYAAFPWLHVRRNC